MTAAAAQDLARLPVKEAGQVARKIARLERGLVGDVKRLVNHEPAYRLRSGNFRVLFDVEGDSVAIKKIGMRRDVYD